MFLADVSVPVLNQIYDFKLDENMKIGILIEEIVEMICQKEQCQMFGKSLEIFLGEVEKKEIFSVFSVLSLTADSCHASIKTVHSRVSSVGIL